jgi:hypothetical protein
VELASSMAPLLLGGRKRKRGRGEWDEGGSSLGAHGVHESTPQEDRNQRGSVHGPGTCLILSLI